MTAGSLVDNILRFVRNIILARLLAPDAFGLMATVIAIVAVMETFTSVGLRQSVIQNKKGADEDFLNVVWWFSSLRGLILYGIAYLAAPFISGFYKIPASTEILRIGSLVILLNGFISPRIHVLEKELGFKNWVILMQGSGIIGVIVGIVSAFFLRNVWALLLAYLTEAFLRVTMSFLLCPIKPQLKINKVYAYDIMRFSQRMFGLPFLILLYAQTDTFVIGKTLSFEALGMYTLAKSLSEAPSTFFSMAINPLILPVLSLIQDDKNRLRHTILYLTRITAIFGIPFFAFLITFAQPILSLAYGEIYKRVAIPFSILCVCAFFIILASLIMQMFFAIGQPNIQRTASIVRTIVFLLLIYPATKTFGLIGASLTVLIATSSSLAIQIICIHKLINLKWTEYLYSLTTGVKLSSIIVIPGIFINMLVQPNSMIAISIGVLFWLVSLSIGVNILSLSRIPWM